MGKKHETELYKSYLHLSNPVNFGADSLTGVKLHSVNSKCSSLCAFHMDVS